MKKLIILVGLTFTFTLKAETYQRMPIMGLVPVKNMYASFKIFTPKYDKIILDCQSFINGMTFFHHKKIVREIKMVNYTDCGDVHDFIEQSKINKEPVCLEIEEESNTLNLSNSAASDCQ
jgi:hypothetical protein